jgi:hypothetical protein
LTEANSRSKTEFKGPPGPTEEPPFRRGKENKSTPSKLEKTCFAFPLSLLEIRPKI